jgi:hypothetical protein
MLHPTDVSFRGTSFLPSAFRGRSTIPIVVIRRGKIVENVVGGKKETSFGLAGVDEHPEGVRKKQALGWQALTNIV